MMRSLFLLTALLMAFAALAEEASENLFNSRLSIPAQEEPTGAETDVIEDLGDNEALVINEQGEAEILQLNEDGQVQDGYQNAQEESDAHEELPE